MRVLRSEPRLRLHVVPADQRVEAPEHAQKQERHLTLLARGLDNRPRAHPRYRRLAHAQHVGRRRTRLDRILHLIAVASRSVDRHRA